jgi:hypothetical protein
LIRLALCNLAGGSERRVRSRAPDMLVDATFHAIADAGSIPAVSTPVLVYTQVLKATAHRDKPPVGRPTIAGQLAS